MSGLTLDTGALIAVERGSGRMTAVLDRAAARRVPLSVPAGVVSRAWRGGPRQARLARLLAADETDVVALDDAAARAVGVVCAHAGVDDVVDVSVVLCARERGDAVVTSEEGDIRGIDPRLRIIAV